MLEEALLRAVVSRAGQTGQVDQEGDLLRRGLVRLRWQVQVEVHLAAGRGGIVGELQQLSTKGGDGCLGCNRHGNFSFLDATGKEEDNGVDSVDEETNRRKRKIMPEALGNPLSEWS